MGQEFNFKNLKLTILTAPENVYMSYDPTNGKIISDLDKLNDASIVCKVSYCSKDIIFMSDAHAKQMRSVIIPVLLSAFNGIQGLQVAHHGYTDTDSDKLYEALNNNTIFQPEFILWPVCYEQFSGNQINGNSYQETPGTNYEGVYYRAGNAAIKDFKAIYPEYNFSMVTTPNTLGNWTFTPVDFVDPCEAHNLGESEYVSNNDGTHTYGARCDKCGYFEYYYSDSCYYPGTDYCVYCNSAKPTEPICSHDNSNYSYSQDSDYSHSIYCEACARTISEHNDCINDVSGYCKYCGNDCCMGCGTWYDGSHYTCINCGKHFCDGCATDNYGNKRCPECSAAEKCWKCSKDAISSVEINGSTIINYCNDHYPDYCSEHSQYGLASDGWYCTDCAGGGSLIGTCAYCHDKIYGGADDYVYENGNYYHPNCAPHDWCAHCNAGISGAEYSSCTVCSNIICSDCGSKDCPLCSEHACGGNITTYICYDCFDWTGTYCSHQQRPAKCPKCGGGIGSN